MHVTPAPLHAAALCLLALLASSSLHERGGGGGSAAQVITTFVGASHVAGGGGDGGPALAAQLSVPSCISFHAPTGGMYIADPGNNRIRRVSSTSGVITTVAGSGMLGYAGDGGPAVSALLNHPDSVAVVADGTLFIADTHNHVLRMVSAATGVITTIAGTGTGGAASSPSGLATSTQLDDPNSIVVMPGQPYLVRFVDTYNHLVRQVNVSSGRIRSLAGIGFAGFSGDGGAATEAKLNTPYGLAVDQGNVMYIADTGNFRVRRVTLDGVITTVLGPQISLTAVDGGAASMFQLNPVGVTAVPTTGGLFVSDHELCDVLLLSSSGGGVNGTSALLRTFAGTGTCGFGGDGGAPTLATLHYPFNVALGVPPSSDVFIADAENNAIRRVAWPSPPPPPAGPPLAASPPYQPPDSLLGPPSRAAPSAATPPALSTPLPFTPPPLAAGVAAPVLAAPAATYRPSRKSNAGAAAGGVVGGVVCVAAAALVVLLARRRSRRRLKGVSLQAAASTEKGGPFVMVTTMDDAAEVKGRSRIGGAKHLPGTMAGAADVFTAGGNGPPDADSDSIGELLQLSRGAPLPPIRGSAGVAPTSQGAAPPSSWGSTSWTSSWGASVNVGVSAFSSQGDSPLLQAQQRGEKDEPSSSQASSWSTAADVRTDSGAPLLAAGGLSTKGHSHPRPARMPSALGAGVNDSPPSSWGVSINQHVGVSPVRPTTAEEEPSDPCTAPTSPGSWGAMALHTAAATADQAGGSLPLVIVAPVVLAHQSHMETLPAPASPVSSLGDSPHAPPDAAAGLQARRSRFHHHGADASGASTPAGGPSTSSRLPEAPTKMNIGGVRWTQGALIDQGGSGRVYCGHDCDGALIAVKVQTMPAGTDQVGQDLLLQELHALQKLKHPNVVEYLGSAMDDTSLYIFMSHEPQSLAKLLKDGLDEGIVRKYTRQILQGLEYVHSQGIWHRDVKAANLLVGADGVVKLTDFGSAKVQQPTDITSNIETIAGTPHWMSPEICLAAVGQGQGYSGVKADVWSLGVTVVEMMMGGHPWCKMEGLTAIWQVVNNVDGLPRPKHASPLALEFLDLCLQRDPAKRSTVAQLLAHPWVAAKETEGAPSLIRRNTFHTLSSA